MIVLVDGVRYELISPENEDSFARILQANQEHIFGPNSFYFDLKKRIRSKAGITSIPDAYIIFFDPNPKWCILEIELASHPIYDHVIPQLTKFNRGIEDGPTRRKLIDEIYAAVGENEVVKAKLKQRIGSGEIYKFLSDLIFSEPLIIVAIDEKTDELEEALRDIRGPVRILEFKVFKREGVSDSVNAYVFDPIVKRNPKAPAGIPSISPGPAIRGGKTTLPVGLKLHKVYARNEFAAEVVEGGRIKFNGQIYDSPSRAAVAAMQSAGSTRTTEDGWRFWKYTDPETGQQKLIDILRKK